MAEPSLLDKYLGPSNQIASEEKPSSLLDRYLPNSDEPEKAIAITPNKVIIGPPRSDNPVESQKLLTEGEAAQNIKEPSLISKAVGIPVDMATTYGHGVAKNYMSGIKGFSEGIKETTENQPFTGIPKIALGALGAVISPVTAAIEEGIVNPLNKIIGKPNSTLPTDIAGNPLSDKPINLATFAERLVSGIPVAKAGQVAVKTLPSSKAMSAIIDTIGKENLPAVIQELKSNERLSLMDVVPATRQMAQKLITTEGGHQNKFEKWVNERIGTAKGATSDIADASMGVPVNIVDKINKFKTDARAVGKKEIEPVVTTAGPVDVSPVITKIDAKLKPGVNSVITQGEPLALGDIEKPLAAVRQFLTDDKSFRTDAKSLHQFQSALRAKADDLLNSQSGQDRQKGAALMAVRNDIVSAIDKASSTPGKYKEGLSKYKDEMDIQNAFQMGQLVTRNKLGRLEDSPEFWNNWVKSASKEELEAAREGARLAVEHQIGGFKAGARKGQDIVESEFNREKLSALFGKEEIDKMAKQLKDERNIAQTNQQLIGNSQTAMRMKADSRVDLPVERPAGLGPFLAPAAEIAVSGLTGMPGASIAVVGAQLANKGAYKYGKLPLAKKRNENITDLLTATGEDRAQLIKILESYVPGQKQSMLRNFALPVLPP